MNVAELAKMTSETVLVPYAVTFPGRSEEEKIEQEFSQMHRLQWLTSAAGYTNWRVFVGIKNVHFYRVQEEKTVPDSAVVAHYGFDELDAAEEMLKEGVAYLRQQYTQRYEEMGDVLARFHGQLGFEQYCVELFIPKAYYNYSHQLCWGYFVSRFGYTETEYNKFLEWVNEVCLHALRIELYRGWTLHLSERFFERKYSPTRYCCNRLDRHSEFRFEWM